MRFCLHLRRQSREAGAMGIMPSHAEIDGIPLHANKKLLKEILREEWGFKGVICSDYYDIEQLFNSKVWQGVWLKQQSRRWRLKLILTFHLGLRIRVLLKLQKRMQR